MNSRQLQYAIKLSETLNFSLVAEHLNISQPALSKQILSLEAELGLKLFDRSSIPLKLTPAGEHFIRGAQALLYQEDQLIKSMEKFRSGEAGRLVIGITPFRSSYLISEIIKKVQQKYPGIQVRLHEAGSDHLRKEAAEGTFDFAIVNLPVDDSLLDVIPLEPDRLVLALPAEMEDKLDAKPGVKEIDFEECRNLPFVVVGQSQEMRRLFDKLCASAGFQPNIVAEVVSLTTAWGIARAGVAATILPLQFVAKENFDNKLKIFDIQNALYTRQPAVVTKRGQYMSAAAAYAIQLLSASQ